MHPAGGLYLLRRTGAKRLLQKGAVLSHTVPLVAVRGKSPSV